MEKKKTEDRKKYFQEYNKNRQKDIQAYNKSHYKRIPLDVPVDEYEAIKEASSTQNESVNGYIRKAVQQRMNSEQ